MTYPTLFLPVLGRHAKALWAMLMVVCGLVAYSPGLRIGYYGDDFNFLFDSPGDPGIPALFFRANPNVPWYRPIEGTLLQFVQAAFGEETLALHLVQLAVHVGLAWVVYIAAEELGVGRLAAAMGSAFFLIAQCCVIGVSSNDTFSQVSGSLFGNASTLLLWRSFSAGRQRLFACSFVAFAFALWSKESSVTFLGAAGVILAVGGSVQGGRMWSRLGFLAPRYAAYVTLTLVYLVVRAHVSPFNPMNSDETYAIAIGPGVVENIGLLSFSMFLPVSSVDVFLAVGQKRWPFLGLAATGTALVAFAVVWGLRRFMADGAPEQRSRRAAMVATLAGLFVLQLFPNVLLRHVSELHSYNALPVLAILVGIGLGQVAVRARPRVVAWAFLALLAVTNTAAVRQKAGLMAANGRRAAVLLAQVVPVARALPARGELFLVHSGGGPRYSVFLLPGLEVLNLGLHRVALLARRDDIRVHYIDEPGVLPPPGTSTLCEAGDDRVMACPAL